MEYLSLALDKALEVVAKKVEKGEKLKPEDLAVLTIAVVRDLNKRIYNLADSLNKRIDETNKRMDGVYQQIGEVQKTIGEVQRIIADMQSTITNMQKTALRRRLLPRRVNHDAPHPPRTSDAQRRSPAKFPSRHTHPHRASKAPLHTSDTPRPLRRSHQQS